MGDLGPTPDVATFTEFTPTATAALAPSETPTSISASDAISAASRSAVPAKIWIAFALVLVFILGTLSAAWFACLRKRPQTSERRLRHLKTLSLLESQSHASIMTCHARPVTKLSDLDQVDGRIRRCTKYAVMRPNRPDCNDDISISTQFPPSYLGSLTKVTRNTCLRRSL